MALILARSVEPARRIMILPFITSPVLSRAAFIGWQPTPRLSYSRHPKHLGPPTTCVAAVSSRRLVGLTAHRITSSCTMGVSPKGTTTPLGFPLVEQKLNIQPP